MLILVYPREKPFVRCSQIENITSIVIHNKHKRFVSRLHTTTFVLFFIDSDQRSVSPVHLHNVMTTSLAAVYKFVRRQRGRGSHPTHIIRHRATQFAQILLMVGFGNVEISRTGNDGQHIRNARQTKHSENGFCLSELRLGVHQNGRLVVSASARRKATLLEEIFEDLIVVDNGGIKNDPHGLHMTFLILKGRIWVCTTTISDNYINNSIYVAEEIVGLPESAHTQIRHF